MVKQFATQSDLDIIQHSNMASLTKFVVPFSGFEETFVLAETDSLCNSGCDFRQWWQLCKIRGGSTYTAARYL